MTGLSAFGLFAVMAMLVTYSLEHRSAWFILAFCCCVFAWLCLRLSPGCMAIRPCGGDLVTDRRPPLVERAGGSGTTSRKSVAV